MGFQKQKKFELDWCEILFLEVPLCITLRPNMAAFVPCYRKIVVYNICLISLSDTVSDGAKKPLVLNTER